MSSPHNLKNTYMVIYPILHFSLRLLHPTLVLLHRERPKAHADGVRVGAEPFTIGEGSDGGSEVPQALDGDLLRREVFLERLGVDATELARVPVRRERVVCTGRVVAKASSHHGEI